MTHDIRRYMNAVRTIGEGATAVNESMEDDFDGYLYHATAAGKLATIQERGVDAGSYWGTLSIVSYYAETVEEEGEDAVVIKAPIAAFDVSKLKPDHNGIEEPLTHTLRMSEEDVWEAWKASGRTWRDSLSLIGSVVYDAVMRLPPAMVDE